MVVVVGIDPTSWAYEARAHPSTPYNQNCFGVSYENRTHDSGITTRGFATKLTSPYGNTLACKTPIDSTGTPLSMGNVFSYGRGARERSEFYWLKASYFTLKFHPHMVHAQRLELCSSG